MDFSAITSAIGSLKTATEIVKAINEIDRGVEINGKVIELQQVILSLQSNLMQVQVELANSQQENFTLTKKVTALENDASFEFGYELYQVQAGIFVYKSKGESPQSEHWLCTNCFGKRQKSILQQYGTNDSGNHYLCPSCDFRLSVGGRHY